MTGEAPSGSTINNTGTRVVAIDSTLSPLVTNVENLTRATLGLTYQAKNGFFVGGGLSWNFPTLGRNPAFSEPPRDPTGDYVDWQFRWAFTLACACTFRRRRRQRQHQPPPAPAPRVARSDRACGLRPVHGGSRQELDRDGDGAPIRSAAR